MTSRIEDAKRFLRQLDASARKQLGQNFMILDSELAYMAGAAQLRAGDTVLEIGPGLGFLTEQLLQKKARVLAVEKDRLYAKFLRSRFINEDFSLVENDILKVDFLKDLGVDQPIKVIGNIPYNITSPILEWLIQNKALVAEAVLTTQLELAERLIAKPGTKAWGVLSIFLQLHADVFLLRKISPGAFYPAPKVDSAVVRIHFLKAPRYDILGESQAFSKVRQAFQKRRKTLLNALCDESCGWNKEYTATLLHECGIDPKRRAETLSLKEWARILSCTA